jgi:hypothetical protein
MMYLGILLIANISAASSRMGLSDEEHALIELLNTQNVKQTLMHKNRRRAEPHIECEQGPQDSDTNDKECHTVRVKLLADLITEHGKSMKLFSEVHSKGKDLKSQSTQATSDLNTLVSAVSEPSQGVTSSARALIAGATDLRQGLVITADRLWSDLITINNLTNQDVDAVRLSSLTGIVSMLNSSQSLLNEDARVHQALMGRIIGRTNTKLSDLSADLNRYQSKLDEALTLYGAEGSKKTTELERLAEKLSQQFESLYGLVADTPEKAKALLNQFEGLLAEELTSQAEKTKGDIQQKVENLKDSIGSKLNMFESATENAIEQSSSDIENLFASKKQRMGFNAQAIAAVASLTRDEIKQLGEFSADKASQSNLKERERLEKLYTDVAVIGSTAGKAGEAARRFASDLSTLITEGAGRFEAELSATDSALRRNLQALVAGAGSASSEQLVALIGSLGVMSDTVGQTNETARKEVRGILGKLEDTLARKLQGQAAISEYQQGAVGALSATLNAELDSSAGAAERSLRGDASALMEAALLQAASLEAVAREADAQEVQLKKEMEAAISSGNINLQSELASKQAIITEHKRETEAKIRDVSLKLQYQGAVANSAATSLRQALSAAGATEEELRKALDYANMNSVADLASRVASGDERLLRKLDGLLRDAKREAETLMQHEISAVRSKLMEMLGSARMRVAEIQVKHDGEMRSDQAYVDSAEKKRRDLETEVLGLSGQNSQTVVADLFRKQVTIRESTERQFTAELLETRGNSEQKLGLMAEELTNKQVKIKDEVKFAFLGQLRELTQGISGQEALEEINALLTEMRNLEWRLFDMNNSTERSFGEFAQTVTPAFESVTEFRTKLDTDMKQLGLKVDELLPELHAKNQTVLKRLRDTAESFAARMSVLQADLEWRKSYLIRSVYGGAGKEDQDARALASLVTSTASAEEKKLATQRLKAIADLQGLVRDVKKEDASIFVKVSNASDVIIRQEEALVNADLRPLIEEIKASDTALKLNITTVQESINNLLLTAADTAGGLNETVQTALLSLKTQANAAMQNTQFAMNVASIQASKMIDFAAKLETEGADAQKALDGYWETAASKAENDAKLVRTTVEDSRQGNTERLSRVFSELGKMDGDGAVELEAQGRSLEIQLAIVRRLVNGLVGVWSEFAEAAADKHKFFESKNKEFLMALESKIDGEKERLNALVKRGLYELSSGVAIVDQGWTGENQFQYEMTRGQDEIKLAAETLKTAGVAKVNTLAGEVTKFDQDEEIDHEGFESTVSQALVAFEHRVNKKVDEVLNLQ